jgi:hypothetical protein
VPFEAVATFPVLRYIHPVFPNVDAPVLIMISPLLPEATVAAAVSRYNLPLDDVEPTPDVTNTSPPLVSVEEPADNVSLPP